MSGFEHRPIQHVCYLVEDIPAAVEEWAGLFGAGPFYWLGRHIVFDETEHRGQPCVFDHSAAIGAWGDIFVELAELHVVEPEELRTSFAGSGDGRRIAHASYMVPDAEAEASRLEGLGMPQFLYARQGPIAVRFHECPVLGHQVEIHEEGDAINGIFSLIGEAARGWDGHTPLREMPGS